MSSYVIGLDQGTTSTRAIVYDQKGAECGRSQLEHRQYYPQPGWSEHDPVEILSNARKVIAGAIEAAGVQASDVAGLGIANQTETTVLWDRSTGTPIANAITWQDTRGEELLSGLDVTGELAARVERECMVKINGYFSATKIQWLIQHTPHAQELLRQERLAFGSIESWLCWNFTGGPSGGRHVTDVSNASRTLLLDMRSLAWSDAALEFFGIPIGILPEVVPTAGEIGKVAPAETFAGIPITTMMGDQQAAAFGQACFDPGEAKCTYGTGTFLIYNTGEMPLRSENGLMTTIVYQFKDHRPVYGLEGSVVATGSLMNWLRHGLGVVEDEQDIERLASSVPDSGGVCIVPAFSGLYAPHWRPEARGTVVGLTLYSTKAHIVRASLEACAFQVHDLLDAACVDTGVPLKVLNVDGGMTQNNLLMQFQADLLGITVRRSRTIETTALGVALSAGLVVGVWPDLAALRRLWKESTSWVPSFDDDARAVELGRWQRGLRAAFAAE